MKARTVKPIRLMLLALCASVGCGASVAHAEMYKWTDAEGNISISNQPPADPSNVKDLTRIEESDRGSNAEASDKEKHSADSAIARPLEPTPAPAAAQPSIDTPSVKANAPAAPAEPALARPAPALAPPRAEPLLARPVPPPNGTEPSVKPGETASSSREPASAKRDSESVPRTQPYRAENEAVRDPCLTSSDPKCHERNKDRYHPYYGYAPSLTQAGGTTAAGATGAASAGGSVGAQVGAAPSPSTAARRHEAVPAVDGVLRFR